MQLEEKETRENLEAMADVFDAYAADPVLFVHHALGHYTWSKQRDILRAVRDHKFTAVRACHGSSKTYTAAELVVWFLNCHFNAKVITTAPTHSQVEMLLWAEINKIYTSSRIGLIGDCFMTKIRTDDPDSYAVGFSTDVPARAEGWHSPNLLFIFDEAKGIPAWLWDSVKGLMTGGHCRFLAISTTDGVEIGEPFYEIFHKENKWKRIHISAFDCPDLTGEKFEYIDDDDFETAKISKIDASDLEIQIADKTWIEECREDWTEESVLYISKVLGELTDQGVDTMIKVSQVERMNGNAKDKGFDTAGRWELGADVARGGDDDTVYYLRKGLKIVDRVVITSAQLPDVATSPIAAFLADRMEEMMIRAGVPRSGKPTNDCLIKVDDTGVGGGLSDEMIRREYEVQKIVFNATANDEDKYQDTISEMWFTVGGTIQDISCPKDERLKAELVNRKSKGTDKKGRRGIESKKDYKKRGFRSPDFADAFLLAFYEKQIETGGFFVSEKPFY